MTYLQHEILSPAREPAQAAADAQAVVAAAAAAVPPSPAPAPPPAGGKLGKRKGKEARDALAAQLARVQAAAGAHLLSSYNEWI